MVNQVACLPDQMSPAFLARFTSRFHNLFGLLRNFLADFRHTTGKQRRRVRFGRRIDLSVFNHRHQLRQNVLLGMVHEVLEIAAKRSSGKDVTIVGKVR
jgi:hypothetical protein